MVNCGCLSTTAPIPNHNSALPSVQVLGMAVPFIAMETSYNKSVQCRHEGSVALKLIWTFPTLFLLLAHTMYAVHTLFTLLLWQILKRLHNFNFISGKSYLFLFPWLGYIWCLRHTHFAISRFCPQLMISFVSLSPLERQIFNQMHPLCYLRYVQNLQHFRKLLI